MQYFLQNAYGGLPQNLATNLIVILILIVLFVVLRKSAWKVVNKIVNKDEVDRWTLLFFSFTTNIGEQVCHIRPFCDVTLKCLFFTYFLFASKFISTTKGFTRGGLVSVDLLLK